MATPRVRKYVNGSDFFTESETKSFPDFRVRQTAVFDVPIIDGRAPNKATVVIETAAGGFGANTIGLFYIGNDGSWPYRGQYIRADGKPRGTYSYSSWGGRATFAEVDIPPGVIALGVWNPITTDPGHATAGTMKIRWWFSRDRVFFGGADHETPGHTVNYVDLRTLATFLIEVPTDQDGDGPDNIMIVFTITGSPASTYFSTHSINFLWDENNNLATGSGRFQWIQGDGLPHGGYTYSSWGAYCTFLRLPVYPGMNYAWFQNPKSTDPGFAVTGNAKIWFFKEL